MQSPHTRQQLIDFQYEISSLGKDIAIIWNSEIERYQIYQVEKKGLVNADGRMTYKPHLIFTVQHKDGSYKPFGPETLKLIAQSVKLGHELWKYKPGEYMDKLEKHEADVVERQREQQREEMRYQIKDMADHVLRRKIIIGNKIRK